MCRSVADAATILSVIAGRDPMDNFTLAQPEHVPDFTKALNPHGLKGVRLGVPRLFQGNDVNIIAAFNASLAILKELGATIVDPADFPDAEELLNSNNETTVLNVDFKVRDLIRPKIDVFKRAYHHRWMLTIISLVLWKCPLG
jgi:amidase